MSAPSVKLPSYLLYVLLGRTIWLGLYFCAQEALSLQDWLTDSWLFVPSPELGM